MTSSTNEAEPKKTEAEKDDISQTEQLKDVIASNESVKDAEDDESGAPKELSEEVNEEDDLDAEQEELKNQLLRLMADNENLRKRTEREVAAAKKYGPLSLARDLLTCVDNLEKAISLVPEDKEGMDEKLKNILVGVEMTGREVAAVFDRNGISKIHPDNEKFDYNLHQAMFEVPTDEVEPGTVVQVVQPGYQLHDRLLRPAMVGVSKAAQVESEESGDS